MDAAGDFVVTWSQQDAGDWNVWAERYDAKGNLLPWRTPRLGSDHRPVMVNTTTTDVQQYSAVAMDADGDFVITWQSMNQDGSGYGIYAQRYDPTGTAIGGTDELNILTFTGQPSGTFTLSLEQRRPATSPIAATPRRSPTAVTKRLAGDRRHSRAVDGHQRHGDPHRVHRRRRQPESTADHASTSAAITATRAPRSP